MPGRLDEAMVEFLIDRGDLRIATPPDWRLEPSEVKAQVAVLSDYWSPLLMDMAISRRCLWRYKYQLRSHGVILRRLDVRGTAHRNPLAAGGSEFPASTTHKHRWTDKHRDAVAYSPSDIPAPEALIVTGDEYRQVFEAFAKECRIELDASSGYRWVEPDVPHRRPRL